MKKRLLLIALVIMLTTGTVVQTEMRAEAAGTVTAVAVVKGVLVLLAIAGVGITLGSIFDQGDIEESAVVKFTNWLNNHDPEFYTEFMLAATAITAGRVINTMTPLFYTKLRQNVREYFGTTAGVETETGTSKFNIAQLSFVANGSQFITLSGYGNVYSRNQNTSYIGFAFDVEGQTNRYVVFLRTDRTATTFGEPFDYGQTVNGLVTNGSTGYVRRYEILGSNLSLFNTELTASSIYSTKGTIQTIIDKYTSGEWSTVDSSVVMAPFVTVGNVAATSVDATVVGAGQTITEDEEGEIVIDGDTTLNLSNVNIDEWLKALAEGTQTYAQAMQAIGLAAVNTQTQTLEEVQAIAQALNPAAAGTGTITGNYTVALSDLFPFCIPFDLYNIISCFKADPVAPSAEITIPVGYDGSEFTWETYTVSLSAFDPVAAVVRVLEYVAFIIGLMLVTRKLIEG